MTFDVAESDVHVVVGNRFGVEGCLWLCGISRGFLVLLWSVCGEY